MSAAGREMLLEGIPASPGVAIGPSFRLRSAAPAVWRREGADPAVELPRIERARLQARAEVAQLAEQARATVGEEEARIFDAHAVFLDDETLFEEIAERCRDERINAEAAVANVIDEYTIALRTSDDELFQARAADLQDIQHRILGILLDAPDRVLPLPEEPSVVLANDLLPSEAVQLDRTRVLALCTAVGGATSHVAILARSLGLPAIVGLGQSILEIADGTPMIADGAAGAIRVHPSEETLRTFRARVEAERERQAREQESAHLPAVTVDGVQVAVLANVSSAIEAAHAASCGAEGVGLLRTELLFVDRNTPPSEDEQVALYRSIGDALGRRPMTIRTLDIGGDKPVPYLPQPEEANPALGVRGIRLRQTSPALLHAQMRAIWRIGPGYSVKVMFPMVASVEEVRWLRQLVADTEEELRSEGAPIVERIEIGIMVEVPSIAVQAFHVAPLVDFFSIGTNDLTQYTLAVDRTNAAVASLSDPFHPAVLGLIARTAEAGQRFGKPVSVCGELAGDPLATAFLLGCGVSSLSMTPLLIPSIKAAIRSLDIEQASTIARQVLDLPTAEETRALLGGSLAAANVREV